MVSSSEGSESLLFQVADITSTQKVVELLIYKYNGVPKITEYVVWESPQGKLLNSLVSDKTKITYINEKEELKRKKQEEVRANSNKMAKFIFHGFRSQDLRLWEIFTDSVFLSIITVVNHSINYRSLHHCVP